MDLAPKTSSLSQTEAQTCRSEQRLKTFMHEVAGRALVMMESATQGQQGIAADLVQEAFIALHKAYADKATSEWYPLFYTILNHKLQDWRRKESRRLQPLRLFRKSVNEDEHDELLDVVDENSLNPIDFLSQNVTVDEIKSAIAALPLRQQQAFMLRAWEGFDTETTAQVMNCSAGSVKTHYHRAIQALRQHLAHLNPLLHSKDGASSHES